MTNLTDKERAEQAEAALRDLWKESIWFGDHPEHAAVIERVMNDE